MKLTRRGFLGAGIAAGAGTLLGALGVGLAPVYASTRRITIRGYTMKKTVCPFCSVGCTMRVYVGAHVMHVEGDADDPQTRGLLCAKGSAAFYLANSPLSLVGEEKTRPTDDSKLKVSWVRVAEKGDKDWTFKSYKDAVGTFANDLAAARDAGFDSSANRTEGVGILGGATMTNEECYLLSKLARALGVVYMDSEARESYMSVYNAMRATTGWNAMTNSFYDLAKSDLVLVLGANPAENQPAAMDFILDARSGGISNKLIVVDPRFTRTASRADIFARLRPGTDMALLGAIIKYIIENRKYHREYALQHTNLPFQLSGKLFDGAVFGGVFRGFDEKTRRYRNAGDWNYLMKIEGSPRIDEDFGDRSVFEALKTHFSRYTLDRVSKVTGLRKKVLQNILEEIGETGEAKKVASFVFSSGVTGSTSGPAVVHAVAIIQMLLGNLGRPGGGMCYLHPYANGQGAVDNGMASGLLPGGFPVPARGQSYDDYAASIVPETVGERKVSTAALQRRKVYFDNMLGAFFEGKKPEEAFELLPREDQGADYSYRKIIDAIHEGKIKGLMVFGHNPLVTCPDSEYLREALAKLDWLCVVDHFETETSSFWKEVGAPCRTYLFPGRHMVERAGSLTSSDRVVRFFNEAYHVTRKTPGEFGFIHDLACLLKEKHSSGSPALAAMSWPVSFTEKTYEATGELPGIVSIAHLEKAVLNASLEIAGFRIKDGRKEGLESVKDLGEDTICGNWLYAGSVQGSGSSIKHLGERTLPRRTGSVLGYNGWSWPGNTRVLFNKASLQADGTVWHGGLDNLASFKGEAWASGLDALDGEKAIPANAREAFWTTREGVACALSPAMVDFFGGPPLPEFYEPPWSPFENELSATRTDPLLGEVPAPENPGDGLSLAVCFSTAEHFQDGSRTRNLPPLARAVPRPYVEIGVEHARELGVNNADMVRVTSALGSVNMQALVTPRMQRIRTHRKYMDFVGLCDNFGEEGMAAGPSAASTASMTYYPIGGAFKNKCFFCKVEKA